MFNGDYRLIDISQPVSAATACFPGDVPFSREVTVSFRESQVINLTAFRMSPHVGTHADAPAHIGGDLESGEGMAAALPLAPFLGPCSVVDIAPHASAIEVEHLRGKLGRPLPARVLFRTRASCQPESFFSDYAYISAALAGFLGGNGVKLVGIDTPSVDHTGSKSLEAHRAMLGAGMCWLENLDLSAVTGGDYILIALPLKFSELEASPVRAVLLDGCC